MAFIGGSTQLLAIAYLAIRMDYQIVSFYDDSLYILIKL